MYVNTIITSFNIDINHHCLSVSVAKSKQTSVADGIHRFFNINQSILINRELAIEYELVSIEINIQSCIDILNLNIGSPLIAVYSCHVSAL